MTSLGACQKSPTKRTIGEMMNGQSTDNSRISKLATGAWFFDFGCGGCLDSGVIMALLGPEQCKLCQASLSPISNRLFGAVSLLHVKGKKIDDSMFAMASALVSARVDYPILGEALASLTGAEGESALQLRFVKRLAQRLRKEWHLPVCGRRETPFGYFIAANADEFLDWMRTTRAQAISELATAYHLFTSNFPQLAGQQSLDFVNTVSTELQEAIR
jgi:hypothetical protein